MMQRRQFLLSLASATSVPLITTTGFAGVDNATLEEIRKDWHKSMSARHCVYWNQTASRSDPPQ